MEIKITIIVPVYNAEGTIERCIQSVMKQQFSDFELIVIDDGSVDKSGELCDRYAENDSRIRVIHQENQGVSSARNVGILAAQGEYVTFLDSDDELEPSVLSQYFEAVNKFQCDIVVGGYTKIEGDKKKKYLPQYTGCIGAEIWDGICKEPEIYGYLWNKLFRLDVLRINQLKMREDMYSQEDLDFCLSAFYISTKVAFISCVGYHYYYIPSKRIPPVWDFIANQIKLLSLAEKKINLSEYARECVLDRIALLLYTCLYDVSSRTDYNDTIHKLVEVEGIFNVLQEIPVKKEKGFIAYCFVRRKYERIRRYFYVRNRIRDLVRKVRRK